MDATFGGHGPQTWIDRLLLEPHPEGGYFREVFRSVEEMSTSRGPRAASTSIYFLLTASSFSALHRIAFGETWYFHAGSDLEVVQLGPDEELVVHRLGFSPAAAHLQTHIPGGCWFGARLAAPHGPNDYALVGCSVAPGFDFRDFEMGSRAELLSSYPSHRDWIEALTRQEAPRPAGIPCTPDTVQD